MSRKSCRSHISDSTGPFSHALRNRGNTIQLTPDHKHPIPPILKCNAGSQNDKSTPHLGGLSSVLASAAALRNLPCAPTSITVLRNTVGGTNINIYHQGYRNTISTGYCQVTLQKGHPRLEWLGASVTEAWYTSHGRDVPGP